MDKIDILIREALQNGMDVGNRGVFVDLAHAIADHYSVKYSVELKKIVMVAVSATIVSAIENKVGVDAACKHLRKLFFESEEFKSIINKFQ